MTKVTKETSLLYNQIWINKAIEDGHYELLPSTKPNVCIGEYIEEQYNLLGKMQETPKITKKESILFNREWEIKAYEDGVKIPRRRRCGCGEYSIGEILELKYWEKELNKKLNDPERTLLLPGEKVARKKVLTR